MNKTILLRADQLISEGGGVIPSEIGERFYFVFTKNQQHFFCFTENQQHLFCFLNNTPPPPLGINSKWSAPK